jgi:dolichol-phosphate mannosyltransferase
MHSDSTTSRHVIVVARTHDRLDSMPYLADLLLAFPTDHLEVLMVDDVAPDGTGRLAAEVTRAIGGSVQLVVRPASEGPETALAAAVAEALRRDPDVVVQLDVADKPLHDAIERLVAAAPCDGVPVVLEVPAA